MSGGRVTGTIVVSETGSDIVIGFLLIIAIMLPGYINNLREKLLLKHEKAPL